MGDAFQGAWSVREEVFGASGEHLGEVFQRRRLEPAEEGRVRVLQDCAPGTTLAGHPMERFRGHHVFELSRDGAHRRYHGPAVVGGALAIGERAMVGRALWPAFGWSCTSFSVLVEPGRQITGGTFFRGGETLATIVGVGAPEADLVRPPHLGVPMHPAAFARHWRGSRVVVDAAGKPLRESLTRRDYGAANATAFSRDESEDGDPICELHVPDGRGPTTGVRGSDLVVGLSRRCGWLLETDAVVGERQHLESLEVLDTERRHLIVIRRWMEDHVLQRLELLRLRPEDRR